MSDRELEGDEALEVEGGRDFSGFFRQECIVPRLYMAGARAASGVESLESGRLAELRPGDRGGGCESRGESLLHMPVRRQVLAFSVKG